jgi:predicted transcriptional regulator
MNAARILRHARRRAGMTQRALAEATGVPQPAIARIESGAVSPRLDTLAPLLVATGTTLEPTPKPGIGVDRTLIRSYLALSPDERVETAGKAARNTADLVEALRRGRSR